MIPIGMVLVWAGYSVGLWGWCLIRDYDVTLGALMSPVHPYGSGKGQSWPPPPLPDTQTFPGKQAAAGSGPGPGAGPGGGGTPPPSKSGKCPPGFLNVGGKCLSEMS